MLKRRTIVNGTIVNKNTLRTSRASIDARDMTFSKLSKFSRFHYSPWLPFIGLLFLIVVFGFLLYVTNSKYLVFPVVLLLWILCLSVHEFGHAYAAYRGGDTTVLEKGYLYLNPFKYATVFHSFVIPIVFMVFSRGTTLFGAAVSINVGMLYSRSWQTGVALSGPLGTFLCLLCLSLPFFFFWCMGKNSWYFYSSGHMEFWSAVALSAYLQLNALVLNLLPIPPLDGFAALLPWLPDLCEGLREWTEWYENFTTQINYGGIVFLFLVVCPSWLFQSIISGLIPCFFLSPELIQHGTMHAFPNGR